MTVTVLIGNSDDKLPQARWNLYVQRVRSVLAAIGGQVHFEGFSPSQAPWQNAAFVMESRHEQMGWLRRSLACVAAEFEQDSIAVIEGDTEMVVADV